MAIDLSNCQKYSNIPTKIGRKIAIDLRNKLMLSLIHQDIAFFDGTTYYLLASS